MNYLNIQTLARVNKAEIQLANPSVSFPARDWTDEDLIESGCAVLNDPLEVPVCGQQEKTVEGDPVNVDGKWYVHLDVVPMTETEVIESDALIIAGIYDQVKIRLDDFAATRGYDSILSLCTYAASPNPVFSAEGTYGVEARDATWEKLYEIMAEVEAGTRPLPASYNEIAAEMPVLEWPVAP